MKKLNIICLLFWSLVVSAQAFKIEGMTGGGSLNLTSSKLDSLDTSRLNVYYKVSYITDVKGAYPRIAYCLLEVGDKFSKFSDRGQLVSDSLFNAYSKKSSLNDSEQKNLLKTYNVAWRKTVIKNRESADYILQDKVYKWYQYKEKAPNFAWKLSSESEMILGYTVHKATMTFKGRDYTAWYTKDIAIPEGPYLFSGLPGLMLRLEDEQKHYVFEAIGIDRKPRNIYKRTNKNIQEVSRSNFRKLEKNYHDNPGGFVTGKAYNGDGSEIKIKSLPYNPIELE